MNVSGRHLLAELQVHLFTIFDGTPDCPKEVTHGLYELSQSLKANTSLNEISKLAIDGEANAAQQLLFLFGMSQVRGVSSSIHPACFPSPPMVIQYYVDSTVDYTHDGLAQTIRLYRPMLHSFVVADSYYNAVDLEDVAEDVDPLAVSAVIRLLDQFTSAARSVVVSVAVVLLGVASYV